MNAFTYFSVQIGKLVNEFNKKRGPHEKVTERKLRQKIVYMRHRDKKKKEEEADRGQGGGEEEEERGEGEETGQE